MTLVEISKEDKEEMELILEARDYILSQKTHIRNIIEHKPEYYWRGKAESVDLLTLQNAVEVMHITWFEDQQCKVQALLHNQSPIGQEFTNFNYPTMEVICQDN